MPISPDNEYCPPISNSVLRVFISAHDALTQYAQLLYFVLPAQWPSAWNESHLRSFRTISTFISLSRGCQPDHDLW